MVRLLIYGYTTGVRSSRATERTCVADVAFRLLPAALSPDSAPAPLILIGHPPLGLGRMYPRLAGRARHYVAEYGFAAATIELPGCGVRPRWAATEQARADLRRAMAMESGGPVGYEGGVISIGVRLSVVEPRIAPDGRAPLTGAGDALPHLGQRSDCVPMTDSSRSRS